MSTIFDITPEKYTYLTLDKTYKNKITKVSGKALWQKWVEQDLIGQVEDIPSSPESSPRIAGGWGTPRQTIFDYILYVGRGENYYQVGSKIISFKTPIDFITVRAEVSHKAKLYRQSGNSVYNKYKSQSPKQSSSNVASGSPAMGAVFASGNKGGSWSYAPASGGNANWRTPVMPIWDSSLKPRGPAILTFDWSSGNTTSNAVDIPRANIGYNDLSDTIKMMWDNTRFVNRLSGSFGKTSEQEFGPSDEFFGYNKVDRSGNVVDWNNPGSNWDPYSVKIDYIIRVGTRQYYNKGTLVNYDKESWATRYVSTSHTLSVFSTRLNQEEVPFEKGLSPDYPYQYQDSIFMDIDATRHVIGGDQSIIDYNTTKIISNFRHGRRICEFEFKVIDRFIKIGDFCRIYDKFGNRVDNDLYIVISARKKCKSTYTQIITCMST